VTTLLFLLAIAIGIAVGFVLVLAGVPALLAGLIGATAFLATHLLADRRTGADR
jgi:hypothetical protein